MNENSGNNLVPRDFSSVHVKSTGTNFACGNYDYRYFLFGLKMTIIVILRSLTHTPTHTLALALALTLTLQDDINLLSKGKGFSKGKCLESKFILFSLALPHAWTFCWKNIESNLTWGFTLTGAYSNVLLPGLSLRVGGRGFSLDYYERGPGYFPMKIEEKWNQKKSLAVWFPNSCCIYPETWNLSDINVLLPRFSLFFWN